MPALPGVEGGSEGLALALPSELLDREWPKEEAGGGPRPSSEACKRGVGSDAGRWDRG